ncbi:MAG: cyclic nucleotide-binding domain-containing protein, partial [Caldilineaceae bacterium]|nr:cyclic nucleotide-binding domain-containing protein [Caldilineaceae bacterium]
FLADAFGEKVTFAAGQSIYTLNEVEDRIFFIDQGQVRIDLADGPHWLGNGAAFGMLAHSGTRTIRAMDHSAHAESNTDVFAIDHRHFVSITGLNPEQRAAEEMQRREETIDNLVVFHRLSKDQRRRLTGFMSHYYFPANHHLIQQGEEADSLWVLLAGGHAAIHALDGHGNKMLTTITTGVTYFGETALLGQMPQDSSIEAQAGS